MFIFKNSRFDVIDVKKALVLKSIVIEVDADCFCKIENEK